MTYRTTSKAKKLWSERANAARERKRLASGGPLPPPPPINDEITITVTRKLTGEVARFELLPGDRADNYSVYCNDRYLGIMGITRVCEGIRKALPRARAI